MAYSLRRQFCCSTTTCDVREISDLRRSDDASAWGIAITKDTLRPPLISPAVVASSAPEPSGCCCAWEEEGCCDGGTARRRKRLQGQGRRARDVGDITSSDGTRSTSMDNG
jgi:hypothetical protein